MKRGHIRKATLTPIVMSAPVSFMLLAYREAVPNGCTVLCFLQDVDSTIHTKNRVDGGNGENSRQAASQTASGGAGSSQR